MKTCGSLVERLSQPYVTIRNWDCFRYDVLPDELADLRVTLERMMIRSFATVFENSKNVETLDLSSYKLVNERIDS